MKIAKKIPGRNKEALRGFLEAMIEKGAAESLFAAAANKRGDSFSYFLMKRGSLPESLDPLPPIMSRSAAGMLTYVEAARERRAVERKQRLLAFQQEVEGPENMAKALENCLNCHNCMRVCPICFCQECYFESSAFRAEGDRFLVRAGRRQGLCLPADTLLFHLGRMSHMSVSCVSCGACEDACPADVPVSLLFSLVGRSTQGLFEYLPGRDASEPVPYLHYEREEFQEMEAPYLEKRGQD